MEYPETLAGTLGAARVRRSIGQPGILGAIADAGGFANLASGSAATSIGTLENAVALADDQPVPIQSQALRTRSGAETADAVQVAVATALKSLRADPGAMSASATSPDPELVAAAAAKGMSTGDYALALLKTVKAISHYRASPDLRSRFGTENSYLNFLKARANGVAEYDAEFAASKALQDEFTSVEGYAAHRRAEAAGRVQHHGLSAEWSAPTPTAATTSPVVQRDEFDSDESFEAFRRAQAAGRVRILGRES